MGEEEKKPEEKKVEEKKPEKPAEEENNNKKKEEQEAKKPASSEDTKKEEKKENNNTNEEATKEEKEKDKTPPPPQEIVLTVYMHCEGCARKVRRCLKGFQGVEDVITDYKTSKVVVKGEKADPIKVLERIQRKSHRQVELISPIPRPPSEDDKKPAQDEKEKPKPEEKKEDPPIVAVVLKVYMHCEACAQEIKKRILRMKGVESAEPDLKSSQVTVKGAFDPAKLVEYVYKRTGKQAVIVKQDSDTSKDNNNKEEKNNEKKGGGGGDEAVSNPEENKKKEESEKQSSDNNNDNKEAVVTEENKLVVESSKINELNYYYTPMYAMELYAYNNDYPPQIFSDENPNACSVM